MVDKKKTAIDEGELRLFRAVWNHSEDNLFVVLKTAAGDFITERSNPSLIKLFHLKPEEASGCSLKELLPSEAYKVIANRYNECLQKNLPITYEESHVIDESGLMRYWSTMILPVTDTQTGEQRIFGMSREVTELKRIEEQLTLVNEKLESAVEERTKELQQALLEMEKISKYDKLTGLYNRHKLDEELLKEMDLAKRYGTCFGLILMDIDNFKSINDSLGHHQGDMALVEFAKVLKNAIRKTDVLGRWGGLKIFFSTPFYN